MRLFAALGQNTTGEGFHAFRLIAQNLPSPLKSSNSNPTAGTTWASSAAPAQGGTTF